VYDCTVCDGVHGCSGAATVAESGWCRFKHDDGVGDGDDDRANDGNEHDNDDHGKHHVIDDDDANDYHGIVTGCQDDR